MAESPWITIGIKKPSKHKQRLYEEFLKTRTKNAEQAYKNCKNLFDQIKKRPKKLHISNLIRKYKNNIKITWSDTKEAITKKFASKVPK